MLDRSLLELRDDLLLVLGGSDEAAAAVRLAFAFDDTDDAAVPARLASFLLDPLEAYGPGCPVLPQCVRRLSLRRI